MKRQIQPLLAFNPSPSALSPHIEAIDPLTQSIHPSHTFNCTEQTFPALINHFVPQYPSQFASVKFDNCDLIIDPFTGGEGKAAPEQLNMAAQPGVLNWVLEPVGPVLLAQVREV